MNKILSLLILGAMMLTHESGAVPLLAPDGRQVPSCGALSDYSNPKAPKEIRSTEISSFSCHFSSYLLSLVREGGYAKMKMVCNSTGRAPALSSSQENEQDYEFEMRLPIKVLSDLERLIRNNEVARINGWHKRNSAIGCNFTLKVDYASGEVISASGEGGVSVVPDNGWRPMDFVNFFLNTAKAHGLDMRKAQRTWKAKHFIEPRSYASFMEQAVGIRLKKDCSLFDRVGGRSVIQGKKGEHFIGIREQLYDTSDKVWYLVLYGVERQEELYLNSLAKRCFVEAKNVSLAPLQEEEKVLVESERFDYLRVTADQTLSFSLPTRLSVYPLKNAFQLQSSRPVRTFSGKETVELFTAPYQTSTGPNNGQWWIDIWQRVDAKRIHHAGFINLRIFEEACSSNPAVKAWLSKHSSKSF